MIPTLLILCLSASVEPPSTVAVRSPGEGGVRYSYRAGEFEVTNRQYADFLNHVASRSDEFALWFPDMRITRDGDPAEGGPARYDPIDAYADRQVQFIRWIDSLRFANWLHNGRPSGPPGPATTEDGAYTLWEQPLPWRTVERSPDARWFVLSEAEFIKAARFDPAAGVAWNFATGSNSAPTPAQVDAAGRVTNPGPATVNHRSLANWDGSTQWSVLLAPGDPLPGVALPPLYGPIRAGKVSLGVGAGLSAVATAGLATWSWIELRDANALVADWNEGRLDEMPTAEVAEAEAELQRLYRATAAAGATTALLGAGFVSLQVRF